MYRGVAKLVGMEILEVKDKTIKTEIETLEREIENYDFIYMHIKKRTVVVKTATLMKK